MAETEKNKSTPTDEVRESDASGKDTVITANGFPSFSEESKPDSETKEVNKGSEVKENLTCACRQEIDRLLERIKVLEEKKEMERFGVKRFMLSDLHWLAKLQYFYCTVQFSETTEIT